MADLIGQSLGRYHVLEQLGEGGMATVYKARDMKLNRDVAVKVIRTDVFGSAILDRILKRFDREAQALAELTHPNIVTILDYGEFNGAPYLVMPFLPGGTLKQRLGKPISWQEAVQMLVPIAQALSHAHQQGIVHRDVKPSNILIARTGEPMLSDFGIAKILDTEETRDLTSTGVGIGTPEYMAPEQGMGQTDERADIYALGIVFYEMIAGRIPYRADTPMAVLLKKNQEPLPRPKQFVPTLPNAVEDVLIKALARDPKYRYQTAAEFGIALEQLVRGETVKESHGLGSTADSNWKWIIGGIGALVVLLVCVIIAIVIGSRLLSPQPSFIRTTATSSFVSMPTTGSMLEAPTAIPPTLPPPSPVPTFTAVPTQQPALNDPAQFARWYFNELWTTRDYPTIWNTYLTPSFQSNASPGGYNEFVSWWSSVSKIDVLSVQVLQNDGHYASIRVQITFYLGNGSVLSNRTYDYNLTYNSQSGTWMFDYR